MTTLSVIGAVLLPFWTQSGPSAAQLTIADMRRDDTRLAKTVTVSEGRVCAGELLEKLSTAGGVSLTADARDGAADAQVAVFVKDRPLGEEMEQLWSLLSFKEAQWRWERNGAPGAFEYTLRRPLSAQNLGAQLHERIQRQFEDDTAAFMDVAPLKPEERKRRIGDRIKQEYGWDDAQVDHYVQGERKWQGLQLFSELPEDQRLATLRGQSGPQIPLSSLSPSARAFVMDQFRATHSWRTHPDGSTEPMPEPQHVSIHSNNDFVAPVLVIEIGDIGGYAYSGAMPLLMATSRWLDRIWILPDDLPKSPDEQRKLPSRAPDPVKIDPFIGQMGFGDRLARLARATGASVLAHRVAQNDGAGPDVKEDPCGQVVSDYLEEISLWFGHKWRCGGLLLSERAWIDHEADQASWPLVKKLREEWHRDGYLSLRTLGDAATKVTARQMNAVGMTMRVMKYAAPLHDMLAHIGREPLLVGRLKAPAGVPLNELTSDFAAARAARMGPPRRWDDDSTIRMTEMQRPTDHVYRFSVRTPGGAETQAFGIVDAGPPPAPKP